MQSTLFSLCCEPNRVQFKHNLPICIHSLNILLYNSTLNLKVRKFKRDMILLRANDDLNDPQIMETLRVSRPNVERIRERYVLGELEKALEEDSRPGLQHKLGGRSKTVLVATA